MKKVLAIVFAAFFCVLTQAAYKVPKGWTADYNAALKEAKQKNKDVLILFTGSDWCSWCIRLKKDVLDRKDFEKTAQKHFILVYFDFPSDSGKLTQQQRGLQQGLARQFGVNGFPTTVIVNADGKKLREVRGYAKLEDYLEKITSSAK